MPGRDPAPRWGRIGAMAAKDGGRPGRHEVLTALPTTRRDAAQREAREHGAAGGARRRGGVGARRADPGGRPRRRRGGRRAREAGRAGKTKRPRARRSRPRAAPGSAAGGAPRGRRRGRRARVRAARGGELRRPRGERAERHRGEEARRDPAGRGDGRAGQGRRGRPRRGGRPGGPPGTVARRGASGVERKVPSAGYATPKDVESGDLRGGDLVTTALQAVGELAQVGRPPGCRACGPPGRLPRR